MTKAELESALVETENARRASNALRIAQTQLLRTQRNRAISLLKRWQEWSRTQPGLTDGLFPDTSEFIESIEGRPAQATDTTTPGGKATNK